MIGRSLSMIAIAGMASSSLVLPQAPAIAQRGSVSEIVVFGTDPCPRSTDDEVVVCARKPESERYRIPEKLRQGGSRQSREAWALRAKSFETVGATGINSCSAVGPGGHTGCLLKIINQARDENREYGKNDRPPEE